MAVLLWPAVQLSEICDSALYLRQWQKWSVVGNVEPEDPIPIATLKKELRQGCACLGTTLPMVARAQQPTMPVIGFLMPQSTDDDYKNVTAPFLQGLKETGYVEGRNVVVEYRYAD